MISSGGNWLGTVVFVVTLVYGHVAFGQFFDPRMEDKAYLDRVENNITGEVTEVKDELLDQAGIIEHVTKNFIATQLKRNIFKALRVLAEKELSIEAGQERPRQPRQDGDDGGDEDGESNTTRRPSMILPQVANLIKAVFGGNINLTSYVESASSLLPKPIANQLVGVVKLLANNPGNKYASTTVSSTSALPTSGAPVSEKEIGRRTSESTGIETLGVRVRDTTTASTTTPVKTTTTTVSTTTEEDEDTEEEFGFAERASNPRQLQIPGLDILGSLVNAVTNNNGNNIRNKNTGTSQSNVQAAQESENEGLLVGVGQAINNVGQTISNVGGSSGAARPRPNTNSNSNAAATANNNQQLNLNGIDINSFGKEIRNGLGDIIKIMPDIFRGAHEAYKLLTTVSSLFSGLDGAAAA